jgi:hypothetical protein
MIIFNLFNGSKKRQCTNKEMWILNERFIHACRCRNMNKNRKRSNWNNNYSYEKMKKSYLFIKNYITIIFRPSTLFWQRYWMQIMHEGKYQNLCLWCFLHACYCKVANLNSRHYIDIRHYNLMHIYTYKILPKLTKNTYMQTVYMMQCL